MSPILARPLHPSLLLESAAVALGAVYILYALRIYFAYSDRLARGCFRYSIVYLSALFAALLVDHYLAL